MFTKKRFTLALILFLCSFMLSGCIPMLMGGMMPSAHKGEMKCGGMMKSMKCNGDKKEHTEMKCNSK